MERADSSSLAVRRPERPLAWGDVWILLGLIGIAVVLPAVVGVASGSLGVPRNDDWTFRRIALDLYETGRLELNGFEAMMLVGQIVIAQPFLWLSGGETWGMSVAGIAFATVAVVAGYLLVRRLLPRGRAALAIVLLPLFPGYLPYATSFMTDVPAIATAFVSLYLGAVALDGPPIRWRWFAASMVVGWIGFTIREFALAAPASVLVLAVLAEPRRAQPWLGGIALAVACLVILNARSALPDQIESVASGTFERAINRLLLLVSSIALVLLPAVIVALATWWRRLRVLDVAIGAAIALVLLNGRIAAIVEHRTMPRILLDNLMGPWGVPGPDIIAGGRPILIPALPWAALNGLALIATVLFLAAAAGIIGGLLRDGLARRTVVAARSGSTALLFGLFVGATAIGIVAFGTFGSVFDRYVWPLIPLLAALILAARPPGDIDDLGTVAIEPKLRGIPLPASIGTASIAVVLALVSISYLLNSAAFDAARWRAGESLVRAGIPASSIDAGFEWVGYHATGPASTANRARARNWWVMLFPRFHLCGLVSTSRQNVPGAMLVDVDTHAYRLLWLTGSDEPLYTYRIVGPGCP